MAKKVKKDGERKEEKKAVFEPPEFDEREYLTEQLQNIRMNLLFTIYAIPFGGIGAYLGAVTGSGWGGLGIAVAGYIAGVLLLRQFLGIDMLEGPKRQIAISVFLFLLSFLAFAVLFSNPPLQDEAPPSVTDVMVYVKENETSDDWEVLMVHRDRLLGVENNKSNRKRLESFRDQKVFLVNEDRSARTGEVVRILVRAADPSDLSGVWIETWSESPNGTLWEMERITESGWDEMDTGLPFKLWGEHYYWFDMMNVTNGTTNLYYRITAEDTKGHTKVFETLYLDTIPYET